MLGSMKVKACKIAENSHTNCMTCIHTMHIKKNCIVNNIGHAR